MGHDFGADFARLDLLEEENKSLKQQLEAHRSEVVDRLERLKHDVQRVLPTDGPADTVNTMICDLSAYFADQASA